MRRGDIAPGEEEIANITGVQASQRDVIQGNMYLLRGRLFAQNTFRWVKVYGPPPIRNAVLKHLPLLDVALVQDVLADEPPAFALPRQEAEPLQRPVRALRMMSAVLDMVPHAESKRQQLVADAVAIGDGV
ncbi:hypothetical protein HRbin16_00805 [bacterium HR16]|nr:hypothetical protein HRbin16_00805 [bacterium HR16]